MVAYKKKALDFWGLDEYDPVFCTWTGKPAVEFHHLDPRGMGGRKKLVDEPFNTCPVSREVHDKAEADPAFNRALTRRHLDNVIAHICNYHGFEISYTLKDVLPENSSKGKL